MKRMLKEAIKIGVMGIEGCSAFEKSDNHIRWKVTPNGVVCDLYTTEYAFTEVKAPKNEVGTVAYWNNAYQESTVKKRGEVKSVIVTDTERNETLVVIHVDQNFPTEDALYAAYRDAAYLLARTITNYPYRYNRRFKPDQLEVKAIMHDSEVNTPVI